MAISNIAIGSTNTAIYTSSGNNAITTIIVCNTAAFDSGNPLTGQTNLYLYLICQKKLYLWDMDLHIMIVLM